MTEDGVAVHPYGALIIPKSETPIAVQPEVELIPVDTKYLLASAITASQLSVGGTLTLAKEV